MSFHPNDIARRARIGVGLLVVLFIALGTAFFNTQVLQYEKYRLQSEENRLRPIPLPAPRGIIYDRNNQVIAENLPAYSISIIAPSEDSLRSALKTLNTAIPLSARDVEKAVRRWRRAPTRPTAILPDASIDQVSVLEEHRLDFPRLIIQSVPKRFYPDGPSVASFVGYTGEITESDLNSAAYQGYKPGQQVGKGGLEKEYEKLLSGQEGMRFDEVDARGRLVKAAGLRPEVMPEAGRALHTNIDIDLQRYTASLFGDSIQGGAMALDPHTGAVLALYSGPSFDPNRFTGGIPVEYWNELRSDPRRPLYNKAVQGKYPPGSTWKLATSLIGIQNGVVDINTKMPVPCSGGYQFGSRWFRCWEKRGHGSLDLAGAIRQSCDTYFYQLGLRIGFAKLIAGGVELGFRKKSGLDLPEESRSNFPYALEYYNKLYGPRGWTNALSLNISIGQGENDQTVANMAKFYTALATDGTVSTPSILKRTQPERARLFTVTPEQMQGIRDALASVVSATGTAGSARIEGVVLAGKTGTSQNPHGPDHAWFVGFAPAEDPKIVVAVMLEFGQHGYFAARVASKIVQRYLHVVPVEAFQATG